MFISVIIPVRDGGPAFARCLEALNRSHYTHWELIVVEDGSVDDSVAVAYRNGARVLSGTRRTGQGPAYARNIGAQVARGEILFFLDADVLVQPGTLGHVAATMQAGPDLAACFGSYDKQPTEENFLSQYRNLQHHFMHQQGRSEATTFWSGCGAIRRDVFLAHGGYNDTLFARPSIEDIELGYRLHAAGQRVRLEKLLQVTHMKRWTARLMISTDLFDRALPWTRLIMQSNFAPNDLNLQTSQRVSFVAALSLLLSGGLSLFSSWWLLLAAFSLFILFWLNSNFYRFLWKERGIRFLLLASPWHWLYFLYSGTAFVTGFFLYKVLQWGKNELGTAPPAALRSLSGSGPVTPRISTKPSH